MAPKIASGLFLLLVICVTIAGWVLYRDYEHAVNDGYGNPDKTTEFIIEEGESTETITQRLFDAGLIKNKLFFKFYLRQSENESNIHAGTFNIPHNLSFVEIVQQLQNATPTDIWVTIPEGLMTEEVADILEEGFTANPQNSFNKEGFLAITATPGEEFASRLDLPEGKPLEGYLYPDTYRFPADATAEYIVYALVENFETKIVDSLSGSISDSSLALYQIVNFASILERETKFTQDRPKVADILIRRYENNWPLAVDATILYYVKDWTHDITQEDLQADHQYNTRKLTGLPPTPICNPGEETIRAVLAPESNNYWFYISDSEGTLYYASTLEEHNQNINTYLR